MATFSSAIPNKARPVGSKYPGRFEGLARPFRFIHTSDIHLDTSFAGSGFPSQLGDRKRESIRASFRRILEDARGYSVDLLLVSGDLFEHDRITPDTVEFLKIQFEALGSIKVFVSPGNHDPFVEGSPYHVESWPKNVHIFSEEEFRSVTLQDLGVRLTGFGFNRAQVEDRPFLKLHPLPRDAFNLVIVHGSDASRVPIGKCRYGPFSIEEVAGKNVHYCAVGHYHEQRSVENSLDDTPVWYSGIPEGRGWDEEGELGYLLGEVDAEGITLYSCPSNQYPLRTLAVDCEGFTSREQILDAILDHRGTAFDPKTILRVRLQGSFDPRMALSTAEIEERLTGEVLHLVWDDRTQPALDFDSISREKTLRGRFIRLLNERIVAASEEERLVLERARLYGIQALLGREVRIR